MFSAQQMGKQLATLRVEHHYTQEQLAEKLRVSPQVVSKWENGKAVPKVQKLCEIAGLFHCSVDRLLGHAPAALCSKEFDFEFLVLPRRPVAAYSGPEWPKSIAAAALLSAVKLFFGLEMRRDSSGRQLHDDAEYILQAAVTNLCFAYSCAPKPDLHDSFLLYGLDYETHERAAYRTEEWIALACDQITQGLPLILLPKDYTDTIFATGFSDSGRTLKGLGFLDGDDVKNAGFRFDRLKAYPGWYQTDCDMLLVRPSAETLPLSKACANALLQGLALLSNSEHREDAGLQGYGLVLYQVWRRLLMTENQQDADQLRCVFPHAFIHYESKLRTKQFLELCMDAVPGLERERMLLAIAQYEDVLAFAAEIASIAHSRDSLPKSGLKEKRIQILDMLRRSSEQEALALRYIQQAVASIPH